MQTITAGEFHTKPGFYTTKAMIEPIILSRHGQPAIVLVNPELFEEYLELKEKE